jgi:hypothetical protein
MQSKQLSVFFFPEPYTHLSTYEVYVYQPAVFPFFIGNSFSRWRHFIENLTPFRMNSLVVQDDRKKVLQFLIDGNVVVQDFMRQINKHFDGASKCKIKIKPQVLSAGIDK